MNIRTFEVGPFLENTYLLSKNDSAILIDPGFSNESEYSSFKNILLASGCKLVSIVLTHAHVDHVLGINRVLRDFKIPIYSNIEDLFLWENFGNQATMFGLREVGFSFTPKPLPKAGVFELDEFNFECLFTPGHSPDHTSLFFKEEKLVVSGDALFRESIGRTDLYKGDLELLRKSIIEKLYTLPGSTTVYPGHGLPTTIDHEKINNPFVKA